MSSQSIDSTAISGISTQIGNLNNSIVKVTSSISNQFTDINNHFTEVNKHITNKFTEVNNNYSKTFNIGTVVKEQTNTINQYFTVVAESSKKAGEATKKPFDTVLGNIGKISETLGMLPGSTNGVFKNVLGAWETFQKGMNIVGSVKESIGAVKELFGVLKDNPMMMVITVIVMLVSALIQAYQSNEGFRNTVNNLFKSIGSFLMPILNTLSKVLAGLWQDVITPLIAIVMQAITTVIPLVNSAINFVIGYFKNLWNTVSSIFGDLGNFFSSSINNFKAIFNGINEFFTGVFTGNWKKAFEGLRDIAGGIFSQIVNVVKTPINLIIDLINGVIGNINNVAKSASGIPGVGDLLKGVNIPKIPKLATGGIIDSPTLAMIGESGREAVMPLENNTGWIDKLATAIASKNGDAGTGVTQNITVNSPKYLNPSETARQLKRVTRQLALQM